MVVNQQIIKVEPTEGVHDIFLVFKNPDAAQGATLMVVMNTTFKTGDAGAPTTAAPAPKTNLEDYVGKYKMTGLPFQYIEISVKDGKLMIIAGEQGGELKATDAPDKFDADGQAIINFIRDDKQKVTKMILEADGVKFDGIRE